MRLLAVTIVATLCLVAASSISGATSSYAVASWYGPGFYGHTMACGGTLNKDTNAVAHKWMACGTRITICYHGRCRRTVVRDRGPYVGGRDFDLAAGLAKSLGFSGVHGITWHR